MADDKKPTFTLISIDLGGLPEVGKALIEKASMGVGGLYASKQIRKIAEAEKYASIIKAQGEIEVENLKSQAAMQRFVAEEMWHQENMESIVAKAIPLLDDEAKPDEIEDDWMANFFSKSRLVSSEEMQELWARILAREANTRGSFSRRTLSLIADLEKSDAQKFEDLCRFVCIFFDGLPVPLIFTPSEGLDVYLQYGVTDGLLEHLDHLGLIDFQSLSRRKFFPPRTKFRVSYFGNEAKLLPLSNTQEARAHVSTGNVSLTRFGKELFKSLEPSQAEGFWEFLLDRWKRRGHLKP